MGYKRDQRRKAKSVVGWYALEEEVDSPVEFLREKEWSFGIPKPHSSQPRGWYKGDYTKVGFGGRSKKRSGPVEIVVRSKSAPIRRRVLSKIAEEGQGVIQVLEREEGLLIVCQNREAREEVLAGLTEHLRESGLLAFKTTAALSL